MVKPPPLTGTPALPRFCYAAASQISLFTAKVCFQFSQMTGLGPVVIQEPKREMHTERRTRW